MSTLPSLPTYTEVANALNKSPAKLSAAQAHGVMCGLLCATNDQAGTLWLTIIFGDKKKHKPDEVLHQLYEESYQQLNDFSFEFSLLLPEEEVDINQRAEALGLWCQGFLTGLDQAKVPIQNRAPDEITEALNDLIEIAKVNYGDIVDNEEDETAYFELVEYVRLAVLMIFQELRSSNPTREVGENNSLH